MSLYTDPRKLRGMESWNTRPFIITKSPTVSVPGNKKIKQRAYCNTKAQKVVKYLQKLGKSVEKKDVPGGTRTHNL